MNCNLCGSGNVTELFDFGDIPYGFPKKRSLDVSTTMDLILYLCNNCHIGFTKKSINYENLSSENLYNSEVTKLVRDHDLDFLNWVVEKYKLGPKDRILEIGCGDGNLLDSFYEHGFTNLLGIDPALHDKNYKYEVVEGFFNNELVEDLHSSTPPNLIIINYTLELIPELDDFLSSLSRIMNSETITIIEVPYLVDFINKKRFDGFAHLRCFWFTYNAFVYIGKEYNFQIIDLEHDESYRGGTLRVTLINNFETNREYNYNNYTDEFNNINNIINNFKDRFYELKIKIREIIETYDNIPVSGYGAGHKANTLIHLFDISSEIVPYIYDRDINKIGKYIPGTDIIIRNAKDVKNKELLIINFAIDHRAEIFEYLKGKNVKGYFVDIIPELKSIKL